MKRRKRDVGAWADGSCWSQVIPLLEAKELNVTAAQIPLTSLPDDIAVTRQLLSTQTSPIVLVGHSYGGAVITGAATETPQVKVLVYITGFGLDEGESLESLSKRGPPSPGAASIRPGDHGYLWIDRATFREWFVADVTHVEAEVMAAVQKQLSVASFTGAEGKPAWKTIRLRWRQAMRHSFRIPRMWPTSSHWRRFLAERSISAQHSA